MRQRDAAQSQGSLTSNSANFETGTNLCGQFALGSAQGNVQKLLVSWDGRNILPGGLHDGRSGRGRKISKCPGLVVGKMKRIFEMDIPDRQGGQFFFRFHQREKKVGQRVGRLLIDRRIKAWHWW